MWGESKGELTQPSRVFSYCSRFSRLGPIRRASPGKGRWGGTRTLSEFIGASVSLNTSDAAAFETTAVSEKQEERVDADFPGGSTQGPIPLPACARMARIGRVGGHRSHNLV